MIAEKLQENPVTAIRTLDVGYCLNIISEPEIFDAVSEDGVLLRDLTADVLNEYWVAIGFAETPIGVAQIKPVSAKHCDAHIYILPEHRKEYSGFAGEALWGWIEDNLPGYLISTTIPGFCNNVINFLTKFDFKETGHWPKAWLKNGELHDVKILTKRVK